MQRFCAQAIQSATAVVNGSGGSLQLSIVSLDASRLHSDLRAELLLHPSEIDVFESIKLAARQRQFLLGRLAVKTCLGVDLIHGKPAEIAVLPNLLGKPVIMPGPFRGREISISHTGAFAVAVSGEADSVLGIDIEVIRPELAHISPVILNQSEIEILSNFQFLTKGEREAVVWSAKEAAAKAIGRGMMESIGHYELSAVQSVGPQEFCLHFKNLPGMTSFGCVRGNLVMSLATRGFNSRPLSVAVGPVIQQLEMISQKFSDHGVKDRYAA